jgi:hypothetical protein
MRNSNINYYMLRDIYPTAGGPSTSEIAGSKVSVNGQARPTSDAEQVAEKAVTYQPASNVFVGGAVFLGLLVLLMFIANRLGEDGEFANIKLSAYNVLIIGLAATVGQPIWKYLAYRSGIKPISDWALAS